MHPTEASNHQKMEPIRWKLFAWCGLICLAACLLVFSNSKSDSLPPKQLAESRSQVDSPKRLASTVPAPTLGSLPRQKLQEEQPARQRSRRRGRRSAPDRSEYTTWEIDAAFADDVFTFVRIQFDSGGARGGGWSNDYPDCDWNFSVRLHELTSLKVDPNGKVLRLTDPQLFDYPWVFMSNVNRMNLTIEEVEAMRKYCLKGGFVMGDDFWAPQAWKHVREQMKRVFPDREPRELGRDHAIFNIVYDLQGVPQVPSIFAWQQGHKFEYWHGDPEGDEAPHFWGYFDDNDRLMALMCHNNDIGDGWEREGENKEYFLEYSERVSYPLGINIITYVMTH